MRGEPTKHVLRMGDARNLDWIADQSVHLVVTSPPYFNLKRYNDHEMQMGHIEDLDEFLNQLDLVWRHCYRVLVPGGRLVCNVGDVCVSRRKNKGRHHVVPFARSHCGASQADWLRLPHSHSMAQDRQRLVLRQRAMVQVSWASLTSQTASSRTTLSMCYYCASTELTEALPTVRGRVLDCPRKNKTIGSVPSGLTFRGSRHGSTPRRSPLSSLIVPSGCFPSRETPS